MRLLGLVNAISSVAGSLLLGCALLAPATTIAAPATVQPTTQLPGLPEAGTPSFIFNDLTRTFGGNIQSWQDNYAIFKNMGDSYNFYAHNAGSFTYLESEGTSYGGVTGALDLIARFDSNGVLQAGSTITITGAITDIGITDSSTTLMTAELVDFVYSGNKVGFSITNIQCADEIVGCATDPNQVESVYFGLAGSFNGLTALNGRNFQTTMMSATTVPIPAAAWLLLSALSALFALRKRREQENGTPG